MLYGGGRYRYFERNFCESFIQCIYLKQFSLKEILKNNLNFKLIFTLQQRQYIMTIILYCTA